MERLHRPHSGSHRADLWRPDDRNPARRRGQRPRHHFLRRCSTGPPGNHGPAPAGRAAQRLVRHPGTGLLLGPAHRRRRDRQPGAAPGSQQLSVSFDGAHFTYHAPASAGPGEMAVRLANVSASRSGGYHLIVGKLGRGKTLSDVKAVIRRGHVTAAPRWFQIMSALPAPPGADAVWGIAMGRGRYALVCVVDATNTLRALTEIRVG